MRPAQDKEGMPMVRVAVIGFGPIGKSVHPPALFAGNLFQFELVIGTSINSVAAPRSPW
jgi:predicted dehydrogenase